MENIPIKFDVTQTAINALAAKYKELTITDVASYKACTQGIAEIRTLRTSVETRRKILKKDAIEFGRRVDATAKEITGKLLSIEDKLKKTKQVTDDAKALIKAEKEKAEQERVETIKAKIAVFPPDMSELPQLLKMTAPEIQEMQDALAAIEIDIEVYQEFTPVAIKDKEEKKKLLHDHYIARIQLDAEEKKRQAETERQEQAKKEQKLETERQKVQLAKIQKEQEAEAQKLRDAQAKIEAQKRALQKEQDRVGHEKAKQIRLEQEKQAQIERDRIAKIEAEKQEQARVEQEKKEKAEREKIEAEEKKRQAELRPDKEALELYLSAIQKAFMAIEEPLMKTPAGNITLTQIQTNIEKLFNNILDIAEDI